MVSVLWLFQIKAQCAQAKIDKAGRVFNPENPTQLLQCGGAFPFGSVSVIAPS